MSHPAPAEGIDGPASEVRHRRPTAAGRGDYYLYRAAAVRYADSLFYESGNLHRTHRRIYALFIGRMFGISQRTFHGYLRRPATDLAGYGPTSEQKQLLTLYVTLLKALSASDRKRCLRLLCECCVRAEETARRNAERLTADSLIECLRTMEVP